MRKNKVIHLANGSSTLTPNIVRGGQAIDLGNNFYYIKGKKHSNGGVDVGKDLEVEGGEVMQMKPNEVRVFSSVPFLQASSPAELVLGGANPDAVFNAQENFKDKNRIKDDGTKYRNGGNMIASVNGNVKNGLIHTMRCGGGKKAEYGSYNNMLGLGRANYIAKTEKDRQFREILNITPNLPNNLTKVNIEDVKKKPKILKGTIRNNKPTVDPIDIFLAEHPNIDKAIELAGNILSTWITLGSGMKGIEPIITKPNISTKQIGNTSKNISYEKPNYPATIKKQKINNPYTTTKTPKEDIIENINIPEQLKLPDSKALYENAVRVGRKQSTMSKSTSRELDKIYNKVVGNKSPRSGFEFKHQPTEITYTPSTNDIGKIYDAAAAEWNKYFGKRLYKDYVRKYGKKGVDKAMKKERISVYKYGGSKKADLGISYFAPSLFGPKYDKVVDITPTGRNERNLMYADATNPNRNFIDILNSGELDNYSALGNFSNRRISGYRPIRSNITNEIIANDTSQPITNAANRSLPVEGKPQSRTTLPTISQRSFANTIGLNSLTPNVDKITAPIAYKNSLLSRDVDMPETITAPNKWVDSRSRMTKFGNWFDNNLDKIN